MEGIRQYPDLRKEKQETMSRVGEGINVAQGAKARHLTKYFRYFGSIGYVL